MSSPTAPTVTTDRLILRAVRPSDLDAFHAIWNEEEVTRFIAPGAQSRSTCWARLLGVAGHWVFHGFGTWAVVYKESGEVIGQLGFAFFERGVDDSAPEAGYVLSTKYQGMGLGTEALIAAIEWFDKNVSDEEGTEGTRSEDHGEEASGGGAGGGGGGGGRGGGRGRRLICLVDVRNLPSIRVAEKVGFERVREVELYGKQTLLMERLQPWQRR